MGERCAHCELPLGRRAIETTIDGVPRRLCCVGCVIAHHATRADGATGAASAAAIRLGLGVFFAMNVMMLSLPTYAPVLYGPQAGDGPLFVVLRLLALCCALPVLILLGGPIAAAGITGLRQGGVSADAMIILGATAAYGLSAVNLARGTGGVYVDTAAMLLVLVTLGRYLDAHARAEAGTAIRGAFAPVPSVATRYGPAGSVEVPVDALAPGDEIAIGAGQAIPADAVVLAGTAGVDESSLTGESAVVAKTVGGRLASGTVVLDGVLRARVVAAARESTAARLARLRDAALESRCGIERLADRAARLLGPALATIALASGVWWGRAEGAGRGIEVALAVLVVACPCALGIATPLAMWQGVATAARRGIVLTGTDVLERLSALRTVLFDKTGTLTTRTPRLVAVEVGTGVDPDELLARVAALERELPHPLARAVVASAVSRGVPIPAAVDVRVVPGRGVRGVIGGVSHLAGNVGLAAEELQCPPRALARLAAAGQVVVVGHGRLLGALRFAEEPRADAGPALAGLREAGLHVGMLSGDTTATAVVPDLLSSAEAVLGLLPEEKLARVRAWRRKGGVAMVGDGMNDAPALAAADVGVAVAQAADLARLRADVVLLTADLGRLPWLIAHARRVVRIARENLAWAFAYNLVAVGLAAAGRLDPVVASLAMIGSSLAVVANARRLRRA